MSLTIHMMTAALSPGDAIGNYILSLTRILREWGCTVHLYCDFPHERYPLPHTHSSAYTPRGSDILWLHYSIYSDNLHWLRDSNDFTIIDSQNVCPARLFTGYDAVMEDLCARGETALDTFVDHVDLAVCHTEYVRADLQRRGYRTIRKLPMIVDTGRFTGAGDPEWEPLLSKLDYLLFVGRLVPQKNLLYTLDVFAELLRHRPDLKYVLVGGRNLPTYAEAIEARAAALGISESLIFAGPIADPIALTSFFRNARFYLCLSEWESFCVPIAESIHFGTPVLGWDVPPIPETMGPGGMLLTGDAAAMAAQINATWDDTAGYTQMQQAGKTHVAHFTDAGLRKDVLDLFCELARG
jgi:L-malate glycosyltransferase